MLYGELMQGNVPGKGPFAGATALLGGGGGGEG